MEATAWQIFEHYFLALLLGAVMGLERERKPARLVGLRTFILVTLFGTICGQVAAMMAGPWVIFAGMIAIAAQAVMVNFLRFKEETAAGLTTSVALLVAYGIGILVALDQTVAAVALSLATTIILYFKPQMHQFSHNLSDRDLHAIFQFGLIAFIILPILPDRGYGPFQALNPYNVWLMVVMISAINLFGYVTLKLIGQRWGGPVLGILGGLVSSTATTLSFSRHARDNQGFATTAALVVALASTVVLVRITFLVAVVQAELLPHLAVPIAGMFLGGLVPTLLVWKKTTAQGDSPVPETRNPMELKQGLFFGFLYALVLLAVSTAKSFFGDKGVYVVSLISGLTDVDAITLTNARLVGTGTLETAQAVISILIAYIANLGFKLAVVGIIGTPQMFRWTLLCFAGLALPVLLVMW